MKEVDLGGWLGAQPASPFAIAQVLEFHSDPILAWILQQPVGK
jgi:hypothetical protein